MGIHTDKAEPQANGEYHGFLTMSRVQRLMSAAQGGQVLISLATEELLRDELPENISLRDMGEYGRAVHLLGAAASMRKRWRG